jgi:small-conductance mechanosensitive channel
VTAPEAPHADLIARLRERAASFVVETDEEGMARQRRTFRQVMREAADALAALSDTVPRVASLVDSDKRAAFARLKDEFAGRYGSELDADINDLLYVLADAVSVDTYENMRITAYGHLADAERERDEARAERDALAHVREQVRAVAGLLRPWKVTPQQLENLGRILDTAPAVFLALHDAEVKAQALDEAASKCDDDGTEEMTRLIDWLQGRAAAIREEAKS